MPPAAPIQPLSMWQEVVLKKWVPFRRTQATSTTPFTCRLVVFPYAGATAGTMRTITKTLPDYIDVWCIQPPGKETRVEERQLGVCRTIAEQFVAAAGPEFDRNPLPTAFFGHSVGSWLAWEVLRCLDGRGRSSSSSRSSNPNCRAIAEQFAAAAGTTSTVKSHNCPNEPRRCTTTSTTATTAAAGESALPFCMFASTFPAPTISKAERPWKPNRHLSCPEFQAELRRWEPDPGLFRPKCWKALGLERFMRIDCRLFDEYVYANYRDRDASRGRASAGALASTPRRNIAINAYGSESHGGIGERMAARVASMSMRNSQNPNGSVLVGAAAVKAATGNAASAVVVNEAAAATTWRNTPPVVHLIMATKDKVVTRDHLDQWHGILPSAAVGTTAAKVLEIDAGHQYLSNPQHAAAVMQHVVQTMHAHLQG